MEIVEIDKHEATAAVYVDVNENSRIISNYVFKKQEDQWNLDLLSTLSLEEKVLGQNLKRSRQNAEQFITKYVADGPTEMSVTYRTK